MIDSAIDGIHIAFTNEATSHRSWVSQQMLAVEQSSLSGGSDESLCFIPADIILV